MCIYTELPFVCRAYGRVELPEQVNRCGRRTDAVLRRAPPAKNIVPYVLKFCSPALQ